MSKNCYQINDGALKMATRESSSEGQSGLKVLALSAACYQSLSLTVAKDDQDVSVLFKLQQKRSHGAKEIGSF